MTLHVFFLFPETAGKGLEQIEEMFAEGVPSWKTHVAKQAINGARPFKDGDTMVSRLVVGSGAPEMVQKDDSSQV
jgi:hypothetical protein